MLEQQVTVVILAGGRSRRMGEQDKGLVLLKGQPLIEHVIGAIQPQNRNILINANRNLEQYRALGMPIVSDELEGFQGPLAGVASAMRAASTPFILTLPCDAPYVSAHYMQLMWDALQDQQTELVVAYDGQRLQPVHALIPVALYADLRAFLGGQHRRVDAWYSRYAMGIADCSQVPEMFHNLNTPNELESYARSDSPTMQKD